MNKKQIDNCDRSIFTLDQFILYQLKIAGHPSENWSDWIDEMDIQSELDASGFATTTLTGIFDQAALLGLLRRLYHLGYSLISVNCVAARQKTSDLRTPGLVPNNLE
jgi:hypothetical protein